jgi:hypothetical protein
MRSSFEQVLLGMSQAKPRMPSCGTYQGHNARCSTSTLDQRNRGLYLARAWATPMAEIQSQLPRWSRSFPTYRVPTRILRLEKLAMLV